MKDQKANSALELLELDDDALVAQCRVDTFRASGPGGQKRNKTSSAVRLRHLPTGLAVTAVEDRSQHTNKARAIRRLRMAIAFHVRTEVDLDAYEPSEVLATCLTRDGAFVVGMRDSRYVFVIRELLDVLTACEMRVQRTAGCIGISTSHLIKLFRRDPKFWQRVNEMRISAEQKPLHQARSRRRVRSSHPQE